MFAQELYINEFQASNISTIEDNYDEYDDWIELYNKADSAISLSGLFISDDFEDLRKWQFGNDSSFADSLTIPPGSFIVLWADDQPGQGIHHIGFKLSANSEQIILSAGDSASIIDYIEYDQQYADVAYGRHPDSLQSWFYFDFATPGDDNSDQVFTEKSDSPEISQNSGYFNSPILVVITSEDSSARILYTTDASLPSDSNSFEYAGPILVNKTMVIRAVTKKNGYLNSVPVSRSYIFEQAPSLPTVYLVTDSLNMWGPTGIYKYKYNGLEKKIHFEYYNQHTNDRYTTDAGVRIHAPDGRAQQSLRLYARSSYGDDYFDHRFFDQKDITKFKRLVLRNGGNDALQNASRSHLRDLVLHQLYYERNSNNAFAAFKMVNVYLNGRYWGIYNLRERQDEYYIQENYPYQGELDLLERAFYAPGNRYTLSGDWQEYDAMRTFLDDNDMSLQENYSYARQLIDMDNFAEYWIFEVFAGNFDWLLNNMRFWRVKDGVSKWRWLLWDTDHGLGLPYSTYGNVEWNTLSWSVSTTGERTGGGSNNIIIRNLLENQAFRHRFINVFADLLNSSFTSSNILRVVDELSARIGPDVPKATLRWKKNDYEKWTEALNLIRNYAIERPSYVREHIIEHFNLSGSYSIDISMHPEKAGRIKVNTLEISSNEWPGTYFYDIPLPLTHKANKGYAFDHWTVNDTVFTGDTIFVSAAKEIICHFIADTIPEVVISEFNYHAADDFDCGDWIEIYNPKLFDLDISGWLIKDDDDEHLFQIPENTVIDSAGYLVFSSDLDDFSTQYPDVTYIPAELDFNLDNKSDQIRIYRSNGLLVDSLQYQDEYPWPVGADGQGATLELLDINTDNALAQNWIASEITGGTPGAANGVVTDLETQTPSVVNTFKLNQNYPNPFNAKTRISFSLPEKEIIEVLVYNNRGQLIERLLEGSYPAGRHRLTWNASAYSSGIYFIQLRAGKSVRAIKSLLIK